MQMSELTGTPIIISPFMTTTKQARTHRKRRINKKWFKRYGMCTVDDMQTVYFIGDKIYMSQGLFNKLLKEDTDESMC